MDKIPVRKHSTATHGFTLMKGGVASVLTDKTVHIVLIKDSTDALTKYNTTDHAGNISIVSAADGTILFTPADGEWDNDNIVSVYFWVDDGTVYEEYPAGEEIIFEVRDAGASYDPAA